MTTLQERKARLRKRQDAAIKRKLAKKGPSTIDKNIAKGRAYSATEGGKDQQSRVKADRAAASAKPKPKAKDTPDRSTAVLKSPRPTPMPKQRQSSILKTPETKLKILPGHGKSGSLRVAKK